MSLSGSVALRPEPFGALAYDFHTRRLSFLKSPQLVDVVRRLADAADRGRRPHRGRCPRDPVAGLPRRPRHPRRQRTSSRSATSDLTPARPAPANARCAASRGRCPRRPVRARPRRPDLPDLGADLRLQPRVRALPVELVGPPRPARADHRGVQGGDRRARSGCRSSTSTSAAASRRCARTSGSSLDYAVDHQVGVKFSTNGVRITPERARRLAATDYVDVQISLDGATAEVNDRGPRRRLLRHRAAARWRNLQDAGFEDAKISVVCTRQNIGQLDEFKAHRRPLRRPAAADPAASLGPRRRRLGRAAPAARAAARALRLADGPRRGRAHRRLVLPPRGVRRGPARASTSAAPAAWSA